MRIVAADRNQPPLCQRLVPLFQTFIRPFEVMRKDQLRIGALRPDDVKKGDDRIDSSRICKDVVNLNTIEIAVCPSL